MHLSKRIVKGLEQGLGWRSLTEEGKNSPLDDLLAHKALIKQREEDILKKAQSLRQKEVDVDKVVAESRDQAHREGFEQGYREASAKAEKEAAVLVDVCTQLDVELKQVRNQLSEKVLKLVVTAARQVVMDHGLNCPQAVAALLHSAVESIASDSVYITVAASQETLDMFNRHLAALGPLSTQVNPSVAVNFKVDARLAPGGFMIFHSAGQMDYSLETRWRNVFTTLSDNPQDHEFLAP